MTDSCSPHSSYETTFKANRRISNIEPQNVEGWNRSRSAGACAACRSVVLKWTEYLESAIRNPQSKMRKYLKSKIRIPKSKIWFLKFLFVDQTGCTLAGGLRS